MAHHDNVCELMAQNGRLIKAMEEIEQMPFSMVNDSESLRYTLRTIQRIAHNAICDARKP